MELGKLILDGSYHVFDRFLSISQIKKQYKASQATVVQALDHLEANGLIFRKSRNGIFVSPTSRTRQILIVSNGTRANSSELNQFSYGLGESHHASQAGWVTINCTAEEFEQNLPNLRIIYKRLYAIVFFRYPDTLLRHHRTLNDMNIFHLFYGSSSHNDILGDCYRFCYNEKMLVTKALDILYAKGHRKIACLSCRGTAFEERTNCYINWMKEKNLPVNENLIFVSNVVDSYEFMLKRLKSARPDCTAFFCSSNFGLGSGLLQALRTLGFRVPEETGIIGIANIETARLLHPSLATVDIDYEKDANTLIDLLSEVRIGPMPEQKLNLGESSFIYIKGDSL